MRRGELHDHDDGHDEHHAGVSVSAAVQMQPAPGPVEITLSMNLLDQARNLEGGAILWHAWAREEGRNGVNVDAFVNDLLGWMRDGTCVLVVAYIDDEPVGMVTMHRGYDASKGRCRVVGERLYVRPEHRDMRVFRALWAACETFSILTDAREEVISCRYGSPLKDWYERAGFKPTDVILKREV
jgi:GNAT superfamily N-acetyltransferase